MTSNGGRPEEPTSYGLQPPAPRPAPGAAHPAQPGAAGPLPAPREAPGPAAPAGPAAERPATGPDTGAGRLVGGRYRLLERLGSGGMGTVWRARDEVVDRDVAVKEPRVPDHVTADERRTAHLRMQREARAAARIDHPSVVAIHDVVTEGESPWIVMELVRGQSLAELLEEGTLPPREAARIGVAVLGALAAAHEAGVLHRDVKPGNVMVGRHERVVLTDFGIAQMEGEEKLTETGGFVGSPEYIAPERVLGRRPGPESDLWSLGVLLYQAVEGVSPFRRQTTPSTLQAILLAELPPPQHAGPLAPAIAGLLRKEPEARLTAPAALLPLRAAAAPPAAPERPGHPPTEAVGPADAAGGPGSGPGARRKGRARLALAAGAAVLAAALVVTLVLQLRGDDLPAGWKRYEEYRMAVAVAAPADWRISTGDDPDDSDGAYLGTWYTSPKGDMSMLVDRQANATETARATAERWKRESESATPPEGGEQAVGAVQDATEQGRDAALLTTSYNTDDDAADRRLRKTLIVVSAQQERLTIRVDVPAGKPAEKTASDLLAKARAAYRIDTLPQPSAPSTPAAIP
ncbi:serine/threonine protein kinase [Streptomyces solincola]|uniref:non-specific serine/threonine protein kinase n=1 Tax=Streptomyces solincola TaxID=2100817 RepID=A0A2S9PPA8_9ACTN|nr:serine/threonine-protein kinase [Streptomyces solincola]PRH76244.1 serine/threonine protein kinase [Streptomyces solincola]